MLSELLADRLKLLAKRWGRTIPPTLLIAAAITWKILGFIGNIQTASWLIAILARFPVLRFLRSVMSHSLVPLGMVLIGFVWLAFVALWPEWASDVPQLRLGAWEQIPDNHPLAGVETIGTMGFPQHGFHIFNDGGPALEAHAEDFKILPSSLIGKSETLSAIGRNSPAFILVWVEGVSVGVVGPINKWNLLYHVRQVSNPTSALMPYGAADYVIPVSVTYREARRKRYHRTTQELHYIPAQNRIAFGAPSYKVLGKSAK